MPSTTTTNPTATRGLAAVGVYRRFQPNWNVLSDVSLSLRRGELLGIVGPNGAGKTTLLRTLAGQTPPDEGEVRLDGKILKNYPRRDLAQRIGFLPHGVRSIFDFTVEETVAQGRYPHQRGLGLAGPDDAAAICRAMEWTSTLAFAGRRLADLSAGERQLVLLASVLAQGSDYILLDEPTSNLDLHHQVEIFGRLQALARDGMGAATVTHDLNLAAQYCDRLALLHEGKLAAEGAPAEVLRAELLSKVYATEVVVERHPATGGPLVIATGRRAA